MDKLNQGLTKGFSFLVGEQATAFTLGLFMPMWYMEGDAVSTETAFSKSGRGRMPSFEMIMRAHIMNRNLYNFEKASLGSFKEYIPDQYYFGYFYVVQSRRHYTDTLWSNAINNSARNWWQISPLSHSFKKQIGYNKKTLYRKFFTELKDEWLMQAASTPTARYANVPLQEKKIYTHYKFPKFLNDTTIIAEKSGMGETAKFISINTHTGEEKTICRPGFYAPEELPALDVIPVISKNSPGAWTADNLSLQNNTMVWAEKQIHPRWEYENYSVIMAHDFTTDKTRQITRKTKYFAPALSSDASKIATVYYDEKGTCALCILDAKNGDEIQRIDLPNNLFIMTPVFGPKDESVYCIGLNPDLKSIYNFNLKDGAYHIVFGPVHGDINVPHFQNDSLWFNASFSGIENVYVIDLKTNNIFQSIYDQFSSTNICFATDGNRFVFQSYTDKGYTLKTGLKEQIVYTPLDSIRDGSIKLYEHYLGQEESSKYLDTAYNDSLYTIETYRRGAHLFHFHSWLPVSVNTDNNSLQPGVSLLSQNLLSTSITELGYEYIPNEKCGRAFTSFSYLGWFPEIELKTSYGFNTTPFPDEDSSAFLKLKEGRIEGIISLPLKTTVRDYFQLYKLSAGVSISRFFDAPLLASEESFFAFQTEMSVINRKKTVLRDLQPRFGQDVRFSYKNGLENTALNNKQTFASATLFFPGIGKHHGTKIDFAWQQNTTNSFIFDDEIIYPRGYANVFSLQSYKIGLNYRFPFAYPDLNVGSVLYFKRLKANLFYDYGEIEPVHASPEILRSTGAEISTDVHVFRFFIPLDIGVRLSYLPVEKETCSELLLGINFSGF